MGSEKKVKDKKEKKEKRSEVDGAKKSKKDKKEKKLKINGDITEALDTELAKAPEDSLVRVVESQATAPVLVPFAEPLASDAKDVKKILKTVKKSAKAKTLRRGVKEVVKYLRKATTNAPPSSDITNPVAIVIIAADISPMDVISHIPVLCEDHNVPYIFVKSRAELGDASATKRPTSVVLVAKERGGKKEVKAEDKAEWDESWEALKEIAIKASRTVTK